jgi:hypothetical protein
MHAERALVWGQPMRAGAWGVKATIHLGKSITPITITTIHNLMVHLVSTCPQITNC